MGRGAAGLGREREAGLAARWAEGDRGGEEGASAWFPGVGVFSLFFSFFSVFLSKNLFQIKF